MRLRRKTISAPRDGRLAQTDQSKSDRLHRYYKNYGSVEDLTAWNKPIHLQVSGKVDEDTHLYSISKFVSYAHAAGEEINLLSFDPEIQAVADQSNLLILFADIDTDLPVLSARNSEIAQNPFVSNASLEVKALIEKGLEKHRDGCFGSWQTTKSNEILQLAIIISTGLDRDEKKLCVDALAAPSFGAKVVYTEYTFSPEGRENFKFADKSQDIFLIEIARLCRELYPHEQTTCAQSLITSIFAQHPNLIGD